jgi:hypothetical protein
LLPNCSGGIANPFDCAHQLIFGHAKMPRPRWPAFHPTDQGRGYEIVGHLRFNSHRRLGDAIDAAVAPWVVRVP